MKKTNSIAIILIIISILLSIYFYPQLPDEIPTHWNAEGEIDDYSNKITGLFLMPFISIILFLIFIAIPHIDPLKKNIVGFRKYFDRFIFLLIAFMFYIHILTILAGLDKPFSMNVALIPAMAILFYYAGILMQNAKRNWFIGIRTPWTLSSEKVWKKTHLLGSRLFKIAGAIILLSLFAPDYFIYTVLILIAFSLYLVLYSYLEYKKEK
jgi:uncharacterized membrane protein